MQYALSDHDARINRTINPRYLHPQTKQTPQRHVPNFTGIAIELTKIGGHHAIKSEYKVYFIGIGLHARLNINEDEHDRRDEQIQESIPYVSSNKLK